MRHHPRHHPAKPTDGAPWETHLHGAPWEGRPHGAAWDDPPSLVPHPSSRTARASFTLVELMIVIVIIAILIGLLLPAIRGAITSAREKQVMAEIKDLEAALASFKGKFGMYPPSSISLYEAATGDPSWQSDTRSGAVSDAQRVRSRAFVRRIWPQFDFTQNRNLNGDTDSTDVFELNGSQCLVFFLGGVAVKDAAGNASMTGFSKNPSNPFATGGNREGPFYEFNPGRLTSGAEFPAYLDPLPGQSTPYAYFSAYDGRGYDHDEPQLVGMKEVYHQGSTMTGSHFKPNTYQIISAGADGERGCGGPYDPDAANPLPGWSEPPLACTAQEREPERDNITNFSDGPLAK